jgi:hypothetical protein
MDTLAPFRRYFRIAALVCSAASAVLTAWFGLQQNPNAILALALAAFLVACSLASDYIVLFISDALKRGSRGAVVGMALAGAFVFSLNLMSNVGSVGWQKDQTVTEAKVQTTNATNAEDQLMAAKDRLAMQRKRLGEMRGSHGWNASVTPHELNSRLETASEAIRQEERRGGCGPKCLALKGERDKVAATLGAVTEHNRLAEMIVATEADIARLTKTVAETPPAVAAADSQSKFFASLFKVDLRPSDEAKAWTSVGMSTWLAIGLCVAPILFGFIGWRTDAPVPATVASKPANENVSREAANVSQPANVVLVKQPQDDIWQVIHAALNEPKRLAA